MNRTDRFLLHNATIATADAVRTGSVSVCGDRIEDVWYPDEDGNIEAGGKAFPYTILCKEYLSLYPDATVMELDGKVLMTGGIDAHVHFREPGMTAKADIGTESKAAIHGGVTSFIDMPNTNPPTVTGERLAEKLRLAKGRSHANFGFHIGATNSNYDEIAELAEGRSSAISPEDFAGIKVFMGSSTGNMLVDDESSLEKIFRIRTRPVLVHCEDESLIREGLAEAAAKYGDDIPFSMHETIRSRKACIRSSAQALELAMRHGTRLHLLHISTAEEIRMAEAARNISDKITAETSVNYLWFSDKDYGRLGSRMKCNPSIKTEADRSALRQALKDGLIDTIGTDHAPHLPEEKERKYTGAPSGMPSIQFSLPVLITVAQEEDIPLSRIASVFSEKAADMFGIRDRGRIRKGYYADIVIADPDREFTVTGESVVSRCGWSPYEGCRLKGAISDVFVNGRHVISGGRSTGEGPAGEQLIFNTR